MWKFGVLLSLLAGRLLAGLPTPEKSVFVFTVSPPEIVTVDASTWIVTDRTSLPAAPAGFAVPRDGRTLYLLVNGATNADGSLPNGPSEVLIFNINERRIVARTEVGWGASRIALTKDESFLVTFRDRPPRREFESSASVVEGAIALIKQAKISGRPSTIAVIDTRTRQLVWKKDLADQTLLYSPVLQKFALPNRDHSITIVDLDGSAKTVVLPEPKGKRQYKLSPSGEWLYVTEDGKYSNHQSEQVRGHIFVIDCVKARLAETFDGNYDSLNPGDGASRDGIAVANSLGVIRLFTAARMTARIDAGREFRFTRWMEKDNGAIVAGKTHLMFVRAEENNPAWAIDWHKQLNGEPGIDIVHVPGTDWIAVPVVTVDRGPDLNRVLFVNVRTQTVSNGVPVGRRGLMTAKTAALVAADVASTASIWPNSLSCPQSFDWNGFAINVGQKMADAFRPTLESNPLLNLRPDGKFAYGVSRFGNDLTIIQIEDATAVRKLALGADTNGALRGDATDLLSAWSAKRLTWINMKTNEVVSTDRPCQGRFMRVHLDPGREWVVGMSDHCARIWDARTGIRLATIEKLGKPRLLLSDATLVGVPSL